MSNVKFAHRHFPAECPLLERRRRQPSAATETKKALPILNMANRFRHAVVSHYPSEDTKVKAQSSTDGYELERKGAYELLASAANARTQSTAIGRCCASSIALSCT